MYTVLIPVENTTGDIQQMVSYLSQLVTNSDDYEIVVLNVFEDFEMRDDSGGYVSSNDMFDETEMPEIPSEVIEQLRDNGIDVTPRREIGEPDEVILEIASEIGANTIIIPARQRSPIGKAVFGSVTQKILQSANCPVTLVME